MRLLSRPLLLLLLLGSGSAMAQTSPSTTGPATVGRPAVDPERGKGSRHLPEADLPSPKSEAIEQPAPPPVNHKRGRPPATPASTLPAGALGQAPDLDARRAIAGGRTSEEIRRGTSDSELAALREAERVLFPRPLKGAEPGWAWGTPAPLDAGGVEVLDLGLVPSVRGKSARERAETLNDAEWLKTLTLPNLPVRWDPRVVKYLKFYRDTDRGRSIGRAWVQKSGRYVASLRAEFAKAGLPTDLIWLSLIESGHNPTIHSHAGAAGLWQFIPESARMYGLTVDRWVDERLDPKRSTEAAIQHLGDLYQRFGNWDLAMAAYNMGYGGLSRAIRKFNTNNFWELCRYEAGIPWETTLYVPKILAIAVVMNNKRAFGLHGIEQDPPVSFDTIRVDPGIPLEKVARAADLPEETLGELNPQYLAGRTPPEPKQGKGGFTIRLPVGKGAKTASLLAKSEKDNTLEPYVVRFGDTVEAIAQEVGQSPEKLIRLNQIKHGETLEQGSVLLVPKAKGPKGKGEASPELEPGDDVIVVPPKTFRYSNRERVFYRVRPGDTLGEVANAFDVTRGELTTWNTLDDSARLQPGMVLQVFVDKSKKLDDVRWLAESDVKVLVAGTPGFFEYHEGLNGRKRLLVKARNGDTLRNIGRRYGMTVGSMERVNRRSRNEKIEAGETIVVYAARGAELSGRSEETGKPLSAPVPPRPDLLPGSDEEADSRKTALGEKAGAP